MALCQDPFRSRRHGRFQGGELQLLLLGYLCSPGREAWNDSLIANEHPEGDEVYPSLRNLGP